MNLLSGMAPLAALRHGIRSMQNSAVLKNQKSAKAKLTGIKIGRDYCIAPQATPRQFIPPNLIKSPPETLLRPLWFIFSGLGAQLNHLPKELWRVEPFAESMKESQETVLNLGMDLSELLKSYNDRIYTDIRAAFVSLTAVQIALYDVFEAKLNAEPSGYVGHSAGELLCGYADDCLTAEQVLLISDIRGQAMMEGQREPGGMASVGLSWQEAKSLCPPDVHPACHNSPTNVTLSGSLSAVKQFVSDLQRQGIFARMVESCKCCPHSPLSLEASELFRKNLQGVIPKPKLRSHKWVCTSAQQFQWDSHNVRFATGEYFVRNMLKQVWFVEALQTIPPNAVVIEVSPRGIFHNILTQTIPLDCTYFAPIQRQGHLHPMMTSGDACSTLLLEQRI